LQQPLTIRQPVVALDHPPPIVEQNHPHHSASSASTAGRAPPGARHCPAPASAPPKKTAAPVPGYRRQFARALRRGGSGAVTTLRRGWLQASPAAAPQQG
jgi:hypothetical protein